MILIDSSAWIEFFRSSGRKEVKDRVAAYIELEKAAFTCPIFYELLAGSQGGEEKDLRDVFSFCKRIEFKKEDWEFAAEICGKCRAKGVTIPADDIFVGAVAIRNGLPLFHLDKHFDLLVGKVRLPLKLEL